MRRLGILAVLAALAIAGCSSGGGGTADIAVPSAPAVTSPAAPAPSAQKTCDDFTTQAAANSYLRTNPAAAASLDPDGNGVACEAKFIPATPMGGTQANGTRSASPNSGTKGGQAGCGQAAVNAGKYDPSCSEYQGYLDPGTDAGRAPTSGQDQQAYGCAQGYIPKSECP